MLNFCLTQAYDTIPGVYMCSRVLYRTKYCCAINVINAKLLMKSAGIRVETSRKVKFIIRLQFK